MVEGVVSPPRQIEIAKSRFIGNESRFASGGAFFLEDHNARVMIHECRFSDNTAKVHGGALYLAQQWVQAEREVTECVFTGNVAFTGLGGPIYLYTNNAQLRYGECHFCGNVPSSIFGTNLLETRASCFTTQCLNPLPIAYPEGIPGACESYVEDFDGLVTEIKPIVHAISGLPTGAVCWRVYAGFDEGKANASVNSIFGNSSNLLLVESQAGFYQKTVTNAAGEIVQFDLARDIDCKSTDPGFLYDSFFTIGGDCQGFSVAQATPDFHQHYNI